MVCHKTPEQTHLYLTNELLFFESLSHLTVPSFCLIWCLYRLLLQAFVAIEKRNDHGTFAAASIANGEHDVLGVLDWFQGLQGGGEVLDQILKSEFLVFHHLFGENRLIVLIFVACIIIRVH